MLKIHGDDYQPDSVDGERILQMSEEDLNEEINKLEKALWEKERNAEMMMSSS